MRPAARLPVLAVLVAASFVPLATGASKPPRAPAGAAKQAVAKKASPKRTLAARRAAARRSAYRAVANLLPNGSFETSTAGWTAAPGSIVLVTGGAVGARAARVAGARGQSSYWALATPRTVAPTTKGRRYTASAWIRSARPGKTVCLRVREWAGSSVVGSASRCAAAGSAWKQLAAVSYTVSRSGTELDLYAYQSRFAAGDSFELDGVTLADASAPPPTTASTTTVPAPPPTTAPTTTAPTTTGGGSTPPTTTTPPPPPPPSGQTWLAPFRPTSLWSRPLPADPQLDPASAPKVAEFAANVRNPNLAVRSWAVAVAVAEPSSPRYSVPCTRYRCSLGAFGQVPIPRGTKPDPSADGHLAIWDPVTRTEWDLYEARYDAATDSWSAAAGAAVSTDTDGITPGSLAAANAANFPLLGGLVRPEEIAAGRIDHALVFSMPNLGTGPPTCPATHRAGSNTSPYALTEGALLQLDPAVDVDAIAAPAWQKTIMRALQRYGMYLRDQGGSLAIYAENPVNRAGDPWAPLGVAVSSASAPLVNVPWSRMRVIAPPSSC